MQFRVTFMGEGREHNDSRNSLLRDKPAAPSQTPSSKRKTRDTTRTTSPVRACKRDRSYVYRYSLSGARIG